MTLANFARLLCVGSLLSSTPMPQTNADSGWPKRTFIHTIQSTALNSEIHYTVVKPANRSTDDNRASLMLLHGRGRSHLSLVDDPASRAALLAQPYFIILPQGFDGWYINSPEDPDARYADALREIEASVEAEYAISFDRNKRAIAGWSMGGYGALHHATQRSERYGFAGALIGLLDFPKNPERFPENQSYPVPTSVFGADPKTWNRFNPLLSIQNLHQTRVFLVIGESAFDRTMNERFLAAASDASIEIDAIRLRGGHTFDTVREGLPYLLEAAREYFQTSR